ncbi:MAG TPA: hypothetical protein VFN09_08505 [Rhodanobacteraceae bacterium]|nr:hypothetical protein [Rhodanobacteraceae bacterium]
MIEDMHVTFYRVAHCGYYAVGADKPVFGNMVNLLGEVHAWLQGKELAHTRIGAASDDSEQMPVYISELHQSQGTYLLTAWNEVPANADGFVASVPANARVGAVQQVNNKVAKGTIPGYPTLFWLLPEKGLLATLRFHQAITGQKALQEYLEQFLATQSSHAVLQPEKGNGDDATHDLWGYRAHAKATPTGRVAPRFRTKLVTKPGEIELITRRVDDIRKVHRRAELVLKDTSERAMWQRAMRFIGLNPGEVKSKKARLQASLSTTLTSAELKTLIKDWRDNHHGSAWDDCGFQFTGESEIHWLSGVRASGDFKIDVVRGEGNAQIETAKLLASVLRMKSSLLGLLE